MRSVVVDTDTGIDDALALVVLASRPDVEVVAVGTTHGNCPTEQSTANARRVLDLCGLTDVPVVGGLSAPLVGELSVAWFIHGHDGLGDSGWAPPPAAPAPPGATAVERLLQLAAERPGELDLVALGPLTNIGAALRVDPALLTRLRSVTVMGGTGPRLAAGDVDPTLGVGDPNTFHDAEAARLVTQAPGSVTLVGVDVTMGCAVGGTDLDRLAAAPTEHARFATDVVQHDVDAYERRYGTRCLTLHDPLAVMVALDMDVGATFRHGPTALEGAPRRRADRARRRRRTGSPRPRLGRPRQGGRPPLRCAGAPAADGVGELTGRRSGPPRYRAAMSGPVTVEDAPPSGPDEGAHPPCVELFEGRATTVGGLPVTRLLPKRARRTVGAWCFVDHFGPADVDAEMQVGPHPHIGLQTVTWVLDGEVLHRDSIGSEQLIRRGQVNLMSAGHGVAHAEASPGRTSPGLHGLQLWVAQPDATRGGAPTFQHVDAVPEAEVGTGAVATVLVGELAGARSPARADLPLLGAQLDVSGTVALPLDPTFEHAVVVVDGATTVDGAPVAPGVLAYLGVGRDELALGGPARLLLLGGPPLEEHLVMWWNFVARTADEVEEARRDWQQRTGRFGDVASSLAPIPAPERRLGG